MLTESVRVSYIFLTVDRKISNMLHISPTLHHSVSGLWFRPPGNCPVVDLLVYGLSVTHPVLSCTFTVLC